MIGASPCGGASAILYSNLSQQLANLVSTACASHLYTIEDTLSASPARPDSRSPSTCRRSYAPTRRPRPTTRSRSTAPASSPLKRRAATRHPEPRSPRDPRPTSPPGGCDDAPIRDGRRVADLVERTIEGVIVPYGEVGAIRAATTAFAGLDPARRARRSSSTTIAAARSASSPSSATGRPAPSALPRRRDAGRRRGAHAGGVRLARRALDRRRARPLDA